MLSASPGISRLVWSELGCFLGLHHGIGGYAGSVGIPGGAVFSVTMPQESKQLMELLGEMSEKYPTEAPKVIYR